jgi:hypothetical protein
MIRGNGIEHNFPYVLWVLMYNVDIRRQTDVIGSKYHTTHLHQTARWKVGNCCLLQYEMNHFPLILGLFLGGIHQQSLLFCYEFKETYIDFVALRTRLKRAKQLRKSL